MRLTADNHSQNTLLEAVRIGGVLVGLVLLSACSVNGTSQAFHIVRVDAARVGQKMLPLEVSATGNAVAYSSIEIRPEIDGQLTGIHFREGQDVKRGYLLFTIDSPTLEATLQEARANLSKSWADVRQAQSDLTRDAAGMKNAEVEARRYLRLNEEGLVARDQYEQAETNATAMRATVDADKAAIETAQAAVRSIQTTLDNVRGRLRYCDIRSPVEGRATGLNVQEGSELRAEDPTPLAVIQQLSPVYVTFGVPAEYVTQIERDAQTFKLRIEASADADRSQSQQGRLDLSDTSWDESAKMMRLRAVFPNQDKSFLPGQPVSLVLTLTRETNALVVPAQAVQRRAQDPFVFLIKPDSTVESRPVVVRRMLENLAVVDQGLAAGDLVVAEAPLDLIPGTRVTVRETGFSGAE
jgi:membrane fusion protein, multidrug efflux system